MIKIQLAERKYRQVYHYLKQGIQQTEFGVGTLLPSEYELCKRFNVTRTTVRKALDELLREGYIRKSQGKGSLVAERSKALGLLRVKGFSESVDGQVYTQFVQKPVVTIWPSDLLVDPTPEELMRPCVFFERLRKVEEECVMLESNWFAGSHLEGMMEEDFIEQSFFKTLSQKYLLEITASEQELRAVVADGRCAQLMGIEIGSPLIKILIRFKTNDPFMSIYSCLYCNTTTYPIGNFYNHT